MSTVLCASAIMTDVQGNRDTVRDLSQAPAAVQREASEGLKGSNSFAKYLQEQACTQTSFAGKPLSAAAAAKPVYAVSNLEFDRQTGLVRVISSQTYAQTLKVSFIDEDDPAHVYQLEADTAAGEFLLTECTAELSQLPEYFTVSAQLVNRLGQPVCPAFTLKTYTRFVQDVRAAETAEFAPEQVVNLDDSPKTNFFVLSEDTVKAESTENCNTLVSADYDSNIYVLDRIDETVRSLKEGQYFYVRPTENDIISTKVTAVEIEGDTATITGADDIDAMFDFIKIEVSGDSENAYFEESGSEAEQISDRRYLSAAAASKDGQSDGKIESTSEFEVELPLNQLVDPDYSKEKATLKFTHKFESKNKMVSGVLDIECSFRDQLNVYKKFGSKDIQFVLDTTAKATATGKLTKGEGSLDMNILKEIGDDKCEGVVTDEKKPAVHIPTPIPGVDIVAQLDVDFKPTLVGTASITYQSTRGFHYDGEFHEIKADSGITDRELDVQASAELKITVKAGVSIAKIFEGGVEFTLGVELSASMSLLQKINSLTYAESDNLKAFSLRNAKDSTAHACGACIQGTFKVTFTAGVYFKCLFLSFPLELVKIPILDKDWYYSLSFHTGDMTTCPHIAYRTKLVIDCYDIEKEGKGTLPADRRIIVDGEAQAINAAGETVLYCSKMRNHTYTVEFDGHPVSTGTFEVKDENKTISIPVTIDSDESGAIRYDTIHQQRNAHSEADVVIVTTAPVTEEPPATTMGTVPKIANYAKDDEAVQLGDNIFGHFYPSGYVWIHGHGDMYDFAESPFSSSKERVRKIVMEDDDPEHGLVIR